VTRWAVLPLDVRVALRLLVKHRWLTVIGTVAIAFAIWIGTISFQVFTQVVHVDLPFEDADRMVGVMMIDAMRGRDGPPTLRDFTEWRERLTSVRELAAYRTVELNVIVGGRAAEPVDVAAISAAAFRVARVQPMLGRWLAASDERPAAPPVVVIGHDVWQTRFASDPAIIGRDLRLGDVHHTIVGVMPEGFRFPLAHSFWIPLPLDLPSDVRQRGPAVHVFGRLRQGATLEAVQAQLGVLAAAAAAGSPDTVRRAAPRAVPFVDAVADGALSSHLLQATSLNVVVLSLVFLICGNVALLIFARAAGRESELLVRAALGASRARIAGQLFVEALVLATVAAIVGLAAARAGWRWALDVATPDLFGGPGAVPFWLSRELSPSAVLYGVVLAVVVAGIAGIVPALKATRGLGTRLRQAGTGGGGLRFGGMWTALIVAEVAVMGVVPALLFAVHTEAYAIRTMDIGVPPERYLSATVSTDPIVRTGVPRDTIVARFAASTLELRRRLEADPGVLSLTFANRLPLMYHPHRRIEIDSGGAAAVDGTFGYRRVSSANVALDFFDVLHAPILAGRALHSGDLLPGAHTVVVNESFVRSVLGGRNPIGRHLRYVYYEELEGPRKTVEPWFEIVGVVRDMGMANPSDPKRAGIYHALVPGTSLPVHLAIETRGDPLLFASHLREIATQADPTIQLHRIQRLDQATAPDLRIYTLAFWTLTGLTSVVLLLSLAGIYAAFSFVATRRTREVGIRVALGGRPGAIAIAIFRRPVLQVVLGVSIGLILAAGISQGRVGIVASYGVVVLAVCGSAMVVPVRRALRVPPTEALRAE
jgi:putative ABC transport system permease protein